MNTNEKQMAESVRGISIGINLSDSLYSAPSEVFLPQTAEREAFDVIMGQYGIVMGRVAEIAKDIAIGYKQVVPQVGETPVK